MARHARSSVTNTRTAARPSASSNPASARLRSSCNAASSCCARLAPAGVRKSAFALESVGFCRRARSPSLSKANTDRAIAAGSMTASSATSRWLTPSPKRATTSKAAPSDSDIPNRLNSIPAAFCQALPTGSSVQVSEVAQSSVDLTDMLLLTRHLLPMSRLRCGPDHPMGMATHKGEKTRWAG